MEALSQHPLVTAIAASPGDVPDPPSSLRSALSQHPLITAALCCSPPQLVAALAQHPMLSTMAGPSLSLSPRSGVHLPRSARKTTTPRRRVETPGKTVVAQRKPLPPRPGRVLARTPDVYVSASSLNKIWTAKQRGRRGYREPIVDAGWGLFLARDMKRDAVVLDYRFVDGREGTEVDRLDADQLAKRYPDPLSPATHVLKVWNSSHIWDTLQCRGIGGFANSRVGHQNCLFRGTKIRIGKTGCKEDTEVFLSYSSSNSYRWASDLQPSEDFYARRTVQPQQRVRVRRPPWTTVPWSATATMDFHARRPPWSTTPWSATPPWAAMQPTAVQSTVAPVQPSKPSTSYVETPELAGSAPFTPSRLSRLPSEPSLRLRRRTTSGQTQLTSRGTTSARSRKAHTLTLPPLPEEEEESPFLPFQPPSEADLEPLVSPHVVAALRPASPSPSGVICFQRSRPGAPSPEVLVHATFDPLSSRGAGTSSFSGLPLGPPSVNGWSARDVIKSLRDYVAITPRVRQRVHQAVDRNPWGQASEETDPFATGPDRGSVAVWVVNLTPSASHDLLDLKDTDADGMPLPQRTGVDFDTDCRWIPSTTALAVDSHGGLRRAQKVNGIRQSPPPTRRPPKPSRAFRGGRFGYDQAMQSHRNKAPTYRTEGRVYALAPALGPFAKWGMPSNRGKRGCGNICPSGGSASSSRTDAELPEPSPNDAALEPPLGRVPTGPVHLASRVLLPHLAVPPLAIHRWHVRMDSIPPPPMVPTKAVIAALKAEHQTAKLFASTTPASPAPTVVDILREAGRRARSRGAAQVTPLDVRHAAQLFAPPRASLVPRKPFVDPQPEHADELPDLFDSVRAAVEASGHRPPRGLSVGDATGIVANAFRRAGCDMVTVDRLPSEDPTMPHIIGDASDFLDAGFDFVVGQPPCTFLCNAGVVWLHRDPNRFLDMHRGAKFFKLLLDADAPFVILENPAMHRYATAAIGGLRPSQYIHPFEHGHGETKSIGIYADGLPLLQATRLVAGRVHVRASLPQSPQRSAIRGRTYLGVAAAMATQWTGVLSKYVGEQRDGIRSKGNGLSSFDLCIAVAKRLDCPLSIRSEHINKEGTLCAASITIPEEFDDTDADVAAAALVATNSESNATLSPEWVCEHDHAHSLHGRTAYTCPDGKCQRELSKIRRAAESPAPPRVQRDEGLTGASKPTPLATSSIAAISPVQRRPLPSDAPTDTRIRRLHLRKNAWWAWAPRHDPADDHLYGWLRLDNNMQQQLSTSLAGLEVPPVVTEEEQPVHAKDCFEPPYHSRADNPDEELTYDDPKKVAVIAAMQQPVLLDRRLFNLPTERSRLHAQGNVDTSATTSATAVASRRTRLGGATAAAAAAAADLELDDPLGKQSAECCTTCGATRTYAPKGKSLPPFCLYASEVTPECRRGVGATACEREKTLGLYQGTLCVPLEEPPGQSPSAVGCTDPFIRFVRASPGEIAARVAAITPWSQMPPRATPTQIVVHMQRQVRRRLVFRHGAARAIQVNFRLRQALILYAREAAATALQRWVRSGRRNAIPFFTTLANVALPSSQACTESDTCSTRAAFGGRQHVAAVWRPVVPADLGPSLTLSTSRSPSRATSVAGSEPDLTFDEEDISGKADEANPLAYCAYLKNVRIAQVWEDGKKRRYRLNSACCWMRSTIADSGAGPSVIGQRLLHALPPDAVVRHVPMAPRMGPVVGPGGERLLMLGTVSIVFTVEGHPFVHRFQVVDGGDLFILGNDFLAQHEAKVEAHLAADPNPGFVYLKHKWGTFTAELVNDPNRQTVAAAAPLRPLIASTPGAALAVLAFVACSGAPPAASEARQFAVASDLTFQFPNPVTPSDLSTLGLGVRGGVTDMERQPKNPARMAILRAQMEQEAKTLASVVASVSGHPTAGFDVHDAEAAAASLATSPPPATKASALEMIASANALLKQEPEGSEGRRALLDLKSEYEIDLQAQLEREGLSHGSLVVKEGLERLRRQERDLVTESDPSLAAAMPDDDTSPADVEDDDGLDHPADNAPFVAPPPNYRFSPWEELKCHGNLLYSEKPIEVKAKTMSTIRLRVPHRLESFTGPVEVSPCSIRHRLDHGLDVARTIGYVDPADHCIPVQISNFTHRDRSVGSLIPISQVEFETVVVHDRRSKPDDTTWNRLPPKTRRALEKVSIDESGVLSPERKARALDLVARHHAAFSTDAKVPGTTHLLEVSVDLKPGSLPFRHAPSRTGTAGEKIIEEAVNDMEANGIIRKSTSQWASRVVLVSKKSSPDPRFCVDLRDLNSRLVVLDTPLPRCDDAIDRLGVASERRPETAGQRDARLSGPSTASPEDASRSPLAGTTGTDAIDSAPRALKMLSKNLLYHTLDLTAGFWNLPVKESHRERLAFVTSKGKWEFNVLPFGLMTGPSYMQRMIEATLVGLNWELCLPYLDDVIIWANGDTEEEAFEQSMERLELVLERLEWAGLRAKPSKCHLFATSVDYLGHVCSRDGVSLDPKKISAVSSINPRSINNLETVRSFLGLAGYYRNHIENFHVLSSPLVDLTKAGVDVPTESQKPEAQAAVANLIKALCSDPVLMYPRSDREFIVATDAATGVGVGACLKQVDDDGTERVVSYHGRRFNKAERNYTVTECELLAVIEAVKHFRPYLWGRRFRLVTDHMALKWLHTMKETVAGGLSSRLTRWTLRLQEHDFEVEHKPGKDHGDADGVSRLVCEDEDITGPTSTDESTSDAIREVRTIIADTVAHSMATGGDPLLTQRHVAAAITAAAFGTDLSTSAVFGSPDDGNPTGASVVAAVASTGTPANPTSLSKAVQEEFMKSSFPDSDGIRAAQLADPVCAGLLNALVTGTVPDSDHAARIRLSLPQAVIHNGLLHRQVKISGRPHHLLWIPDSLQFDVTRAFHDQCNHRGREPTYQAMRKVVYWPGMFEHVADHVLRCHPCSFAKRPNRRQGRSFTPDVGTYPFDCLVCDVLDMSSHIGATARGNTKLVIFADSLSRWVEAIPVKGEPTSEEVLDLFTHHIFSRYGLPRTVRCDGGSNLGSMLVQAVYDASGIELAEATAHHHNSAGLVERFNDTLCGMVRASTDEATTWDELLPFCLFAYRSTPHRVTHESPAYLLYGRELRGPHHVGLLDATPLSTEARRLDDDGRAYYDRFIARMRVAWNVAYHSTRSQQDNDRQERDRKADTSPSYEPNDRVLLRVPLDKKTHKLSNQWEGPYRIASPDGVLPHGNYRLTDLKDRRRREEVSGDRLRLYLTVTDADRIQPDEFLVDQILKSRGTWTYS